MGFMGGSCGEIAYVDELELFIFQGLDHGQLWITN